MLKNMKPGQTWSFGYVNHRGEGLRRTVRVEGLSFGTVETWYPEPTWLLNGHDLDRDAPRSFALEKIDTETLIRVDSPAYPDSFADQPVSVGEIRAGKAKGGADLWSVRDALLACLRDHDSRVYEDGGFKPDQVVIVFTLRNAENDTKFRYYQRVISRLEQLGIHMTAVHDCNRDGGG